MIFLELTKKDGSKTNVNFNKVTEFFESSNTTRVIFEDDAYVEVSESVEEIKILIITN